jgi:hypothetical protein
VSFYTIIGPSVLLPHHITITITNQSQHERNDEWLVEQQRIDKIQCNAKCNATTFIKKLQVE